MSGVVMRKNGDTYAPHTVTTADRREVFAHAHALIVESARWTSRSYAVDKDGRPCGALSDDAVAWCASGAIRRAAGDLGYIDSYVFRVIANDLAKKRHGRHFYQVNDEIGHHAAVAMLCELAGESA